MDRPIMRNQELFDYLYIEHGVTLLGYELYEIELIVERMLAKERECEAIETPRVNNELNRGIATGDSLSGCLLSMTRLAREMEREVFLRGKLSEVLAINVELKCALVKHNRGNPGCLCYQCCREADDFESQLTPLEL